MYQILILYSVLVRVATYVECVSLKLQWCSDEQVPKLSNGPDGNLAERMLTDVLTQRLVEPLYAVAVLLCVLRDHGNDGAHQLLSHMAACLHVQEAKNEKGKLAQTCTMYELAQYKHRVKINKHSFGLMI